MIDQTACPVNYVPMSIEELEMAVAELSRKERTRLIAFIEELDAAEFDAQIERDVRAGKFDKLAEAALADLAARRFRKL